MAKKQPAAESLEKAREGAETHPAKETRKAKEPKPREPKVEAKGKESKSESKSKDSKVKESRSKAPGADAGPAAAASTPPAPVSAAPAAAQSSKRKGKRPGVGPHRGKKLRELIRAHYQRLAQQGPVPLPHAVEGLKRMKRSKFDETVEIHMSLGIDTSQNDQMVRGSVPLPHGIGKSVRVIVFCQGDNVSKAKEAGADFAGGQELIQKIQQENWLDFDVALATQDMMGMVSRLGKVLGPRGLMPTPKAGTVITAGSDVAAAVREFKAGKVEFRADKGGNVHAGVGKLSFADNHLVENITAFVDQIRAAKPAGVKGHYVKSITLSATMSPGIPVTV
jgi:large subunit ribosomal protein L1